MFLLGVHLLKVSLNGVAFVDSFLFTAFTLQAVSLGIEHLRRLRAFGLARGECETELLIFH